MTKTADATVSNGTTITPKQVKLAKLGTLYVTRAIKALDNVGKLPKYEPTTQQTAQILNAISEAYETAVAKFEPKQTPAEKPSFTLSI
jgi:hypothetical protein